MIRPKTVIDVKELNLAFGQQISEEDRLLRVGIELKWNS